MDIKESRKCPVCGKYNEYLSYSEWGWGNVELHYYYCLRCTYFAEQVYSTVCEGISTDCPEEYIGRAKELKLDFYKPGEIPRL